MGPFDLLRPAPTPRFGAPPARNAFVELHNLIAAASSIREFGPPDRGRISRQHGVDLAREFHDERVALYQALLDDRLANADLDAADRAVLAHVARTLALSAADLRPAHERAFGMVVADAVADDCLSVEERLLVYKLQHLLGLDPRLAEGAYDVIAREQLLKSVASSLCDGELSPGEEAQIALAESALSVELPPEVRALLSHARQRWQIRNGDMPTADLGVTLQAGEVGRFKTRGQWAFADADALDTHVGEAVLHTGRTAGLILPRQVLSGRVRVGEIALTSRRLLLTPEGGLPDAYRLDLVVQTLRFRNGMVVRTQAGRRVYLHPGEDLEALYGVLYRTLHAGRVAEAG